jgi:hypothetical protein
MYRDSTCQPRLGDAPSTVLAAPETRREVARAIAGTLVDYTVNDRLELSRNPYIEGRKKENSYVPE